MSKIKPKSDSTFAILAMAYQMLPKHEKRRAIAVAAMSSLSAFAEMIAMASILPFLAMLGNPNILSQNVFLARLGDFVGASDQQSFLWVLGMIAFGLLLFAALVRMFAFYGLARFAQNQKHTLAVRRLKAIMAQPYAFFLTQHSGELSKGVLSEIDQLVHFLFMPASVLIMQSMRFTMIVLLLFLVDPKLALIMAAGLFVCYLCIQLAVRQHVSRLGQAQKDTNSARYKATGEAFANIKQMKVGGGEQVFIDAFATPSRRAAEVATQKIVINQTPRIVIEAIAVGAVIALSLVFLGRQASDGTPADLGNVLPLLGLYALAGYRLLPACQAIFGSANDIRYAGPILRSLHGQLSMPENMAPTIEADIEFDHSLSLCDVEFVHQATERASLHDITLDIKKGQTVGIVGPSGAGKTTLVDVILGLLPPTHGMVCIDDAPLTRETTRGWQRKIGYVPQDIVLTDASAAANIALYVADDQIDMARVIDVAKIAQIHDRIQALPSGYKTAVGERGTRLSGGERQRMGVARALYHDPEILILDEATGALDAQTEAAIFNALRAIGDTKTILMIAHRLSTLEAADTIVCLDAGRIAGMGPYAVLAKDNAVFQSLQRASIKNT